MKHPMLALCILGLALMASAQTRLVTPPTTKSSNVADDATSRNAGAITGRVVNDEGQPMPDVDIIAAPISAFSNQNQRATNQATTDEDGNFRLANLPRGVFMIFTGSVQGYADSTGLLLEQGQLRYFRPGDTVNITLVKGGVITGQVTNARGEPMVQVGVRATRVREADDTPQFLDSPTRDWMTDDRGIYRIYGLAPGSYIIAADPNTTYAQPSPHDPETITYYPSATRSQAAVVTVRSNEEAIGIDIQMRGDAGHSVRGLVTLPGNASLAQGSLLAMLKQATSGSLENVTPIRRGNEASGSKGALDFSFTRVPDGEYEIVIYGLMPGSSMTSSPRRVIVKGADVTGLSIPLTPLGSIAGRIVKETARSTTSSLTCVSNRSMALEETLIIPRPITRNSRKLELSAPMFNDPSVAALFGITPNSAGDFTLRHLEAGSYRLEAQLPDDNWYVRALTLPSAATSSRLIDVMRFGFTLKPGEQITGLTITLAEGAAGLRGRVVTNQASTPSPAHWCVHLIPAEPTSADDVLRYAQTNARSDGSFTFTHLAPGRYWLIARPLADHELNETAARPLAWDDNERTKLRREAEAAKVELELRPCQRVNDYALRYAPR